MQKTRNTIGVAIALAFGALYYFVVSMVSSMSPFSEGYWRFVGFLGIAFLAFVSSKAPLWCLRPVLRASVGGLSFGFAMIVWAQPWRVLGEFPGQADRIVPGYIFMFAILTVVGALEVVLANVAMDKVASC